jgi:hypothetical protein
MTAGNVVALPVRPSEAEKPGAGQEPKAQYAPARPREEAPAPRRSWRVPSAAAVGAIFAGASWVHGNPPSCMDYWALHKAAADYLPRGLKYPRLAYGVFHAFIEAPVLYLLVLAGDSLPKRAAFYATVALVLWLTHVI